MADKYVPGELEAKWQRTWAERGLFRAADLPGADKFYLLEMFPYPSGRLHMGHVRNYAIGDVAARFHRMRGKAVLHPMGWDAFGLPAEQAAMERQLDPKQWTFDNIDEMRRQLKLLGLTYDWDRELATCVPEYYRWEQLVFVRMLERGLAYRRKSLVNWSDALQTVLANEQVIDGRDYKLGEPVVQRELEQWFLRTTAYAERLLAGVEALAGAWPERVLLEQRARIGKSHGTEIRFPLEQPAGGTSELLVFTTRPDTLFGVTFMSLAVEHPLALELARGGGRESEVRAFVDRTRNDLRRMRADELTKDGVFTGAYCTNPATGGRVPIFIANFVLMDYGTGAVMAVPAHDQRDFEFARKFELPIKVVIAPPDGTRLDPATMDCAYVEEGRQVNSAQFDGLPNSEGMQRITAWLAERGQGGATVSWRLRDWCVSRQRSWGCPIPVVHCAACGVVPVPEAELPVVLPPDLAFDVRGGNPLARHPTFPNIACPKCGGPGRRETDTLDTFVESSWYFLRYCDPQWDQAPVRHDRVAAWMPVDQYIGGIEHAVGHLMYARFYHMVLKDLGFLPASVPDEPFARLLTQGMVCKETYFTPDENGNPVWHYPEEVEDGKSKVNGAPVTVGRIEKMSKSKRNVVGLEAFVERYGADTARLFTLFAAPPEKDLEWRDEGVEGCWRFLARVWRITNEAAEAVRAAPATLPPGELPPRWQALRRLVHQTIRRVTRDIDGRFHLNTAVSAIMELTNALADAGVPEAADPARSDCGPEPAGDPTAGPAVRREAVLTLLRLLSPFAPHLCDELWQRIGQTGTVLEAGWPAFDEAAAAEEVLTVVVQVLGKLRGQLRVPPDATREQVVERAQAEPNVARFLEGKKIVKTVFVPGKLVNFVVK
ncbi:MAG: leucine--tRNA ligase [Deltaproteobacteria bacterium]|nr:leucine--tRNA ligase [Deltaproteobacteria bacterium]